MPTCLNHSAEEATRACATCLRPFCEQCLVEILGRQLCQECKAAAVEDVFQRKSMHSLAIAALVVPIAGYIMCLPIPITSAFGLWLGVKVLRDLAREPHLTGRSVALAGLVVSGSTLGTFLLAIAATVLLRLTQ